MRPKIVVLTLLVAMGLVGLLAALKGVMQGHTDNPTEPGVQAPGLEAHKEAAPSTTNLQANLNAINPNSSNAAAALEQVRAAEIQKELDAIRELQGDTMSPTATAALLAKLSHPEGEVRKAAIEALVQQNDTNAIPAMEQAVATTTDAREKVALMDAVAFLKLPEITPDSADATNAAFRGGSAANPGLTPGKRGRRATLRSAPTAPSPAQPITPGAPPAQ